MLTLEEIFYIMGMGMVRGVQRREKNREKVLQEGKIIIVCRWPRKCHKAYYQHKIQIVVLKKKKTQHPSLFPLGLSLLSIISPAYVLTLWKEKKKNQIYIPNLQRKEEKNTYIALLNERLGNVGKQKYINHVSTGDTGLLS